MAVDELLFGQIFELKENYYHQEASKSQLIIAKAARQNSLTLFTLAQTEFHRTVTCFSWQLDARKRLSGI